MRLSLSCHLALCTRIDVCDGTGFRLCGVGNFVSIGVLGAACLGYAAYRRRMRGGWVCGGGGGGIEMGGGGKRGGGWCCMVGVGGGGGVIVVVLYIKGKKIFTSFWSLSVFVG